MKEAAPLSPVPVHRHIEKATIMASLPGKCLGRHDGVSVSGILYVTDVRQSMVLEVGSQGPGSYSNHSSKVGTLPGGPQADGCNLYTCGWRKHPKERGKVKADARSGCSGEAKEEASTQKQKSRERGQGTEKIRLTSIALGLAVCRTANPCIVWNVTGNSGMILKKGLGSEGHVWHTQIVSRKSIEGRHPGTFHERRAGMHRLTEGI